MDDVQVPASIARPVEPTDNSGTPVVEATKPFAGSVPLLQLENNAVIHAAPEDVDVAVRSGLYTPKKDQKFILKNPDGELGEVLGQDLKELLDNGYHFETPEEVHNRQIQQKYGDQLGRTFLESAASSASFGATDWASRLSGVPKEDLAGREEANPVASNLGMVAGFIPGLFTGGTEAGVLAKVVGKAGAPVAKVSAQAAKVEAKVAAKLAAEATKSGVPQSAIKSMLSKLAAKGAGGAVEGAYLGGGQLLHETALGKADFNAENLVADVGMGALIGGGLSAGIGAAMAGIGGTVRKGKQLAEPYIDNLTNKSRAAYELFGYTPSQIVKAEKLNPNFGTKLQEYAVNDIGIMNMDSAEALMRRNGAVKDEAGTVLGELYKTADNFETGVRDAAAEYAQKAKAEFADLAASKGADKAAVSELAKTVQTAEELATAGKFNLGRLKTDLADLLETKFLSKEATSTEAKLQNSEIRKYYDELIKSRDLTQGINFTDLQNLRKAADIGAKMDKLQAQRTPLQMAMKEARDFYAAEIRRGMEVVSKSPGNEALYNTFKKANERYSMSSWVEDKIAKKMAKAEDLNPLLVAGFGLAAGVIAPDQLGDVSKIGMTAYLGKKFLQSDVRRNLVVLGKIERAQQSMNSSINSAVNSFFKPTAKATEMAVNKSLVSSPLGKDEKNKKPETETRAYQNFLRKLDEFQKNPEKFQESINKTTSLLYPVAPLTSSAMDATAIRAMNFLSSKVPRRTSAPGVLDLMKKPKLPSTMDMAKFNRYLSAVEDPKTVFKQLQSGKMSTEGMEAIKAVYPTLFDAFKEQLITKVQEDPDSIGYNTKLQLSSILGVPLDESLLPQNVLGLQATFSQEPNQAEGAVNTTVGGVAAIDKSSKMASETESLDV
jgi:hypothetical protein